MFSSVSFLFEISLFAEFTAEYILSNLLSSLLTSSPETALAVPSAVCFTTVSVFFAVSDGFSES